MLTTFDQQQHINSLCRFRTGETVTYRGEKGTVASFSIEITHHRYFVVYVLEIPNATYLTGHTSFVAGWLEENIK